MTQRALYPDGLTADMIPLSLSPAVLSYGHLIVSGMTRASADGAITDDPETQFRAAFDKTAGVIAAGGADLGMLVDMTSDHIDIERHVDGFARVQADYVRPPLPAWTAVGKAELRRPAALVEIKVSARAPLPTEAAA